MKVFRAHASPFRAADVKTFVGAADTRLLAASDEGTPVHVYEVRFQPGGRTNWHTHSGPQWLLVTEGCIRVQCWGDAPQDVDAGDAVVFAPGEKHWHGSTSGRGGVHLAINVNVNTDWLEPVTDEQFNG